MEKVIVIDFGSQYSHLIARRIRELKVFSELVPFNTFSEKQISRDVKAIILSGGPSSVYNKDAPRLDKELFDKIISHNVGVLGICYGHQLLATLLGGRVERGKYGEYGISYLNVVKEDIIFKDTPRIQRVWMSHRDFVSSIPPHCVKIAETDYSTIAAFRCGDRIYGIQFHPEVKHTEYGMKILENFLYNIAGCKGTWNIKNIIENKIRDIKRKYKDGNILMAISGGVDSTTAAFLIKRAVGPDKLHLVFVNTGLLREKECEKVLSVLNSLGFKHVHYIDAEEEFLNSLKGVIDPEEKRRIISAKFIEVFNRTVQNLEKKYGKFAYLGQGTIYPDRIESGRAGSGSDKIKSHHNVAIPVALKFELIEPLSDLYKDEVRKIALLLGIPLDIVYRHPFPGPGLAIRIIGEVNREKLRILRKADAIVEEEFKRKGLYNKVWQAFPVLLSEKSVGVRGDSRFYGYIIALRVVVSDDAMTASPAEIPWQFLFRLANRIINEVPEVSRVLYDITTKPPATIEFE